MALLLLYSDAETLHDNGSCSNCTYEYEEDYSHLVPLPTKVTVATILLLVCLTSVITNVVTLYVFIRYPKPFTPTTACVVSLATSDLIMTLTIGPADSAMFIMDMQWMLGKSYCRTGAFFQFVAVFVSCATLCAIAAERHYSVLQPVYPRVQSNRVVLVVGGIWFVSVCMSVPTLFMYDLEVDFDYEPPSQKCMTKPAFSHENRRIYLLCVFLLAFLPSLLLTTVLYTHLAHFLWVRKTVGNPSRAGSIPQVRRKKRIVKTLVVLTLMFIGCRAPIHVYSMVREFVPMPPNPAQQVSRIFLITLNLSNAAANPLLYSLFHEHLRRLLVSPVKRFFYAINPRRKKIGVWTSSENGLGSQTLQSPPVKRVQFQLDPRRMDGSSSGTQFHS